MIKLANRIALIRIMQLSCLILPFSAAGAQPTKVCDPVLIANVEYDTLDRSVKLAWLKTITNENFAERKAAAGGSIKYDGVDLGANYDEFDKNRSSLFQKEQYSESQDTAISKLRYVVPDSGRSYWLECIKTVSLKNFGLHVWVERENQYGADVHVFWNPMPPAKQAKLTTQTLIGGSVPSLKPGMWLPEGLKLEANGNTTALIQRETDKEIRGTVTFNGITEGFYIPNVPKPRLSASIVITGEAVISRAYTESFNVRLAHHQCVDTRYWRPFQLCSADTRRRPSGVQSYGAVPIQGRLAEYQCFQPIAATMSSGSAPNCATVNILYNECHWRIEGLFTAACWRGVKEGTPIDISIEGAYDESVVLPQFTSSAPLESAKRWVYPSASIPAAAKNVRLFHSATIVDLMTGEAIQLDDNNPSRGGFSMSISDSGRTVVILRDQAAIRAPITKSLGWDTPATQ